MDPGRFRAPARLACASVLLLDDTWTSGSSAQSAAIALKLARARRVAVVTLGRHVSTRERTAGSLAAALAGRSFRPDLCAVHDIAARSAAGSAADRPGARARSTAAGHDAAAWLTSGRSPL